LFVEGSRSAEVPVSVAQLVSVQQRWLLDVIKVSTQAGRCAGPGCQSIMTFLTRLRARAAITRHVLLGMSWHELSQKPFY